MKKNKIFLIGNIVFALSQWIILMILTKTGSLEQVGYYSLSLAYSAPFIVFANMQMRSLVATDTNSNLSFKEYFTSRIIILSIVSIFFIIFVTFFLEGILLVLTLAIYLVKIIESLTDLIFGEFQREERLIDVGKSQIFRGTATILFFGGSFIFFNDLIVSVCTVIIITFCRLVFVDYKKIVYFISIEKQNLKTKVFNNLLITSLPLGFVSLLNSLNTNIPRYTIENSLGIEDLAIFTAISYFTVAGTILVTPILNIYLTPLAKFYNKKEFIQYKQLIMKLVFRLIIISCVIIVCTIVLGKFVLEIMYSDLYAEFHQLFILVSIATSISFFSALVNSQLIVMKLYKVQPYINLLLITFVILNSIYLIPKYGILGAGFVMLINYVTHIILVLGYIYMKYRSKKTI